MVEHKKIPAFPSLTSETSEAHPTAKIFFPRDDPDPEVFQFSLNAPSTL